MSATTQDQVRRMTPIAAPPEQREEIAALLRLLDEAAQRSPGGVRIIGPEGREQRIPDSMLSLLERIAELLARGEALSVLPVEQELTTQQAADLLNVSRQYLVRLLDQGAIPCTRTGTHRRVRSEDLLAYKRERDRDRAEALDELAALSQAAGGYDEIP